MLSKGTPAALKRWPKLCFRSVNPDLAQKPGNDASRTIHKPDCGQCEKRKWSRGGYEGRALSGGPVAQVAPTARPERCQAMKIAWLVIKSLVTSCS